MGAPGDMNGNGGVRWSTIGALSVPVLMIASALIITSWTANTAADRAAEFGRRLDSDEITMATNRVEIAELRANQVEIDTQLRASIDDDNKSLAWQLRVNAMLWEQAFHGKSTLPVGNAFYPNIANGQSR